MLPLAGCNGGDNNPAKTVAVGVTCLTSDCHGNKDLAMTVDTTVGTTVSTEKVPLYVDIATYGKTKHGTVECTSCHTGMVFPHQTGANASLRTYGSWARFSAKNTDVTKTRNFYTVPATACLACHKDARYVAFAASEHGTIKDMKFNANGTPRVVVPVTGTDGVVVKTNEDFIANDCERCHIGNNCGTCHFKTNIIQKEVGSILDYWTNYGQTAVAPDTISAETHKGNRSEWGMDRTFNIASHNFLGKADLQSSNNVCTACHTGYYQGDKSKPAIGTAGIGIRRHPQAQELELTVKRGMHASKKFCTDCHTELHSMALANTEAGGRLNGKAQCINCHIGYPTAHSSTAFPGLHADVTCIACHDAELSLFPGGKGLMRDAGNGNKVVVKALKHDVEENWPSHNLAKAVTCRKCHVTGNSIGAFNMP